MTSTSATPDEYGKELLEEWKEELKLTDRNNSSLSYHERVKSYVGLIEVVNKIYGWKYDTFNIVVQRLSEIIAKVGEDLEKFKHKGERFKLIFYTCYESDLGLPRNANTWYVVLTTIFKYLNAVDEGELKANEGVAIVKSGELVVNTSYFGVGGMYKFDAKKNYTNYREWFDDMPLDELLEHFLDIYESPTFPNSSYKSSGSSENEGQSDDSENLQQIKNDIKALKQIKHDTTIDEPTREATKSTIKALKEKKKSIKHGKRRNPPKTATIGANVDYVLPQLIVKNEGPSDSGNIQQEKVERSRGVAELREDERRKRLLAEAFRRLTEQLKARQAELKAQRKIAKQNTENEVLQNKQMKSTNELEQKAEQVENAKINKLKKSIFNAWREEANKDVIDLRKNPPKPEQRHAKDEAEEEFYRQQFKEQAEQAVKEYNDIITERMNALLQHFNDIVNSDLSNEEKHEAQLKANDKIDKLYKEMEDMEKMAKQELKLLYERLPIMSYKITRLYHDIQRKELFSPMTTYIHLTNERDRIFEPLDHILREAADKAREELWESLGNSNLDDDTDFDYVSLPDKLAIEQQTKKEEIKPVSSKSSEKTDSANKQSPKRRGKRRNPPKIDIDVSVPNEIKTTYDARRKIATIKPVFKAKLTF